MRRKQAEEFGALTKGRYSPSDTVWGSSSSYRQRDLFVWGALPPEQTVVTPGSRDITATSWVYPTGQGEWSFILLNYNVC